MGLLFLFGTQDTKGADDPFVDNSAQLAQEKASKYQKKLKNQRKATRRWQKKADRWAHKRGAHVRHKTLPLTPYISVEWRRLVKWRKVARKQNRLSVAYKRSQAAQIGKCARLGPSRALCKDIIRGAKMAGKPSWAFDPNLMWIIRHESGFRPCVRNGGIIDCNYKGNRAYGLFQFLGSTWGGVGCRITPAADIQTMCGIRYISRRYHTPTGAVNFWRGHHWY